MDYTISNNARLFDAVIEVLSKHQNEPGVVDRVMKSSKRSTKGVVHLGKHDWRSARF